MPTHDNPLPFQAHVELLQQFIALRTPVVERIQQVLIAQQKTAMQQDRALLARLFDDCFYSQPDIPPELCALRGQLQTAHWADGFKPRVMPGVPNEMFDPADMITRACSVWQHTRWPGRNGRTHYAQTLFNLQVVRSLTLLVMRLCDVGPSAGERVKQLQTALDTLWKSSPADQPVLLRDVRWLVPVAQSPTTDDLGPYFEAARKFEEYLPAADRLEINKASLLLAGGHLRSQLRHFTMQGKPLGDKRITLSTRRSNALDCAMTIQHLVPLLAAYKQAVASSDASQRCALAGIICQGLSADPELFVNRPDLLGAYSTIQHLFVTSAGGRALTPMGQRHAQLVQQYVTLMQLLAQTLSEDCAQFTPVAGTYSPYGIMFGFSSNILEHMALKTLQPGSETRFSLEDAFSDANHGTERLAWVRGWRRLPHVPSEVLQLYEYPQAFAGEIFARVEKALRQRACGATSAPHTGRLFLDAPDIAALSVEYLRSSDPALIAAGKAQASEQTQLLADRHEGMHLISYPTSGGWIAISKDLLTELLGAGIDVNITGVPDGTAQELRALYPALCA